MALTPLDIHNKEFDVKLRGYDKDEVNDFLDQVIKDYEAVLKENDHLTESLKQSQEKLKYFNDLKDSLNQSIIVAQEAADKVKANSQREAEIKAKTLLTKQTIKHATSSKRPQKRPRSWRLKPTICASRQEFSDKSSKS